VKKKIWKCGFGKKVWCEFGNKCGVEKKCGVNWKKVVTSRPPYSAYENFTSTCSQSTIGISAPSSYEAFSSRSFLADAPNIWNKLSASITELPVLKVHGHGQTHSRNFCRFQLDI